MTPETRSTPRSNTQRALDELRDLIFSGDLPAGSDHLEVELAQRLGMSRTPIREAMLTLEAQGLVEVRPRKGFRILSLSAEDMEEIYQILTELESLAAERAAARGLSEADLAILAQAIADMDDALSSEDRIAWAKADDRFHAELVRLGGNARVAAIVGMYNDQVRRARATTLYMRPLPHQSNADHRAVYAAILDGDQETARKTHAKHRTNASRLLTELLQRPGMKHL